jgi:hypothetical protein
MDFENDNKELSKDELRKQNESLKKESRGRGVVISALITFFATGFLFQMYGYFADIRGNIKVLEYRMERLEMELNG